MEAAEYNHTVKKKKKAKITEVLDALMCGERDEDVLYHLLWWHYGIKLYIRHIYTKSVYCICGRVVSKAERCSRLCFKSIQVSHLKIFIITLRR